MLLKLGHLVPKGSRESVGRLDPQAPRDLAAQTGLQGLLALLGQGKLAHAENRGHKGCVDFRDQKAERGHRGRPDQRVTPDHKAPLVRLVLLGLLVLGRKVPRGHKVRLVLQVV